MTPIDLRNETFDSLASRVTGDRAKVLHGMRCHYGLRFTRQGWAVRLGMDYLSIAPRITELFQLGFVALDGADGRKGLYRVLYDYEARAAIERAIAETRNHQLPLAL